MTIKYFRNITCVIIALFSYSGTFCMGPLGVEQQVPRMFHDAIHNNHMLESMRVVAINFCITQAKSVKELPKLLHHVIMLANQDVITLAIVKGANTEERNSHGDTALIHAAKKKQIETCRSLIASGADVSTRNIKGRTAFVYFPDLNYDQESIAYFLKRFFPKNIRAQLIIIKLIQEYALHEPSDPSYALIVRPVTPPRNSDLHKHCSPT